MLTVQPQGGAERERKADVQHLKSQPSPAHHAVEDVTLADANQPVMQTAPMYVAVRLRPRTQAELKQNEQEIWACDKQGKSISDMRDLVGHVHTDKAYGFDYVCTPEEETTELYKNVVRPLVLNVCEGVNGNVFAYGQTASGKTYTTLGTEDVPGIILLSIGDIFHHIRTHDDRQFLLRVACFEIYNETVTDLLGGGTDLKVIDDTTASDSSMAPNNDEPFTVNIVGLKETYVRTPEQFVDVLVSWQNNRTVASTAANDRSSRSHTIFRIIVESRPSTVVSMQGAVTRVASLHIIDLAGSECISQLRGDKTRQQECKHINKSLLGLSRVIMKLGSSKGSNDAAHIPYRDSKLTRLLQPALGGNSRTAFICTVNPTLACWEESHNTLRFGSFAKKVTQVAVVNEAMDQAAIIHQQKKQLVELGRKAEAVQRTVQAQAQTLAELQRDNESFAKNKQQLESELTALRSTAAKLESLHAVAASNIAQLEQKLAATNQRLIEAEPLATQAGALQRSVSQLKSTVRSYEERKQAHDRDVLELSVERDTFQADRERLLSDCQRLQQQWHDQSMLVMRTRVAALCNGVKLEKRMGKAANGKHAKSHVCSVWLSPNSNTLNWKSKGMTKKVKCVILSQVSRLDIGSAYAEESDDKMAEAPEAGSPPRNAPGLELVFTTPLRTVAFVAPNADILKMCVDAVRPLCTHSTFQLHVAGVPVPQSRQQQHSA